MPEPSFTVADVARVVGEDKAIRPIHVGEQANIDQVRLAGGGGLMGFCFWCGLVVCGVLKFDAVWCGLERFGVVLVRFGVGFGAFLVRFCCCFGVVWCGLVWFGVGFGVVWCGMVRFSAV